MRQPSQLSEQTKRLKFEASLCQTITRTRSRVKQLRLPSIGMLTAVSCLASEVQSPSLRRSGRIYDDVGGRSPRTLLQVFLVSCAINRHWHRHWHRLVDH